MGGPARHARHHRRPGADPQRPGPDLSRPRRGLPPGTVPSPNIWHHTEDYELENRSVDPEGRIEAAMRSVCSWSGRAFLDVGCGAGFHLPRWAAEAAHVTGVEPHPGLVALARRRTRRLGTVTVRQGTAQAIPLPDASVDVAQARWAYFFGPGCEPGLRELERVVRRGGTAFVVDNDASRSTFGAWFRLEHPGLDPAVVERFWSGHGWTRIGVDLQWSFASRAELERVVRIELSARVAERVLAGHEGTELDCAVNVWWRSF